MKEEAGPGGDSLSFDTPVRDEDSLAPADDLMTLDEDVLLPAGDESETATLEELPTELVLDELGTEPSSRKPAAAEDVEELPGLDMDGIEEIEMDAQEVGASRATMEAGGDRSDETIDLETCLLYTSPSPRDCS